MAEMTQAQKESMGLNIVVIVVTALVTGAITWGANNQRITYLEREIADIRPILMRIDRTLSTIEQSGRECQRRIDRVENKVGL
jgi:Tfp pilus assembly protein PilN